MKKYVFLILFFAASVLYSQLLRGYGVKFGATFSNQDWDYQPSLDVSLEPDNRTGLNIGIFAELLNHRAISIVTELNYIQKGMKEDVLTTTIENPFGTGETITWDTRLDYINISALGKFRIKFGVFTPYVLAGPKIDFEIDRVFSLPDANIVEEEFVKNRLGFKVGLGTEINLLALNLLAEVLYDADFNELFENENLKVNTSSIDLRLGIMF